MRLPSEDEGRWVQSLHLHRGCLSSQRVSCLGEPRGVAKEKALVVRIRCWRYKIFDKYIYIYILFLKRIKSWQQFWIVAACLPCTLPSGSISINLKTLQTSLKFPSQAVAFVDYFFAVVPKLWPFQGLVLIGTSFMVVAGTTLPQKAILLSGFSASGTSCCAASRTSC